jgi:hypothetical protein
MKTRKDGQSALKKRMMLKTRAKEKKDAERSANESD